MATPRIIVITAPSGSGKTTIVRGLQSRLPELRFSVSATTRKPRLGERDGIDYHFMTVETFETLIRQDAFFEHEEVYPGIYYGTLRSTIENASREAPVLLDVDVQGALNVQHQYPDACLTVFVQPPSLTVLEERLRSRDTESQEVLQVRLRKAAEEMNYCEAFSAVVINHDREEAVAEALALVQAFLSR